MVGKRGRGKLRHIWEEVITYIFETVISPRRMAGEIYWFRQEFSS